MNKEAEHEKNHTVCGCSDMYCRLKRHRFCAVRSQKRDCTQRVATRMENNSEAGWDTISPVRHILGADYETEFTL